MPCAQCVHFERWLTDAEHDIEGHCQRFPPQVVVTWDGEGVDYEVRVRDMTASLFPRVLGRQHCGEFRERLNHG